MTIKKVFAVDDPFLVHENDKEANDILDNISSRKAFALRLKQYTSSANMDPRYPVLIGDTTAGAFTITLPVTTYWGLNKTPIIIAYNKAIVNNMSLAIDAGDTIAGAAGPAIVGPGIVFTLIADPAARNWVLI